MVKKNSNEFIHAILFILVENNQFNLIFQVKKKLWIKPESNPGPQILAAISTIFRCIMTGDRPCGFAGGTEEPLGSDCHSGSESQPITLDGSRSLRGLRHRLPSPRRHRTGIRKHDRFRPSTGGRQVLAQHIGERQVNFRFYYTSSKNLFYLISEQFQSHFRAISEPFQSNFW